MPTNPHYEAVRKAVISVCSEYVGEEKKYNDFMENMGFLPPDSEEIFKDLFKSPRIRLSHILRTLMVLSDCYRISCDGRLFFCHSNEPPKALATVVWDMEKDDLEEQRPVTWEALDKMLSV